MLLREISQKNGYPENFIDSCFNLSLNRINSHLQRKNSCSWKSAISPFLFRHYITCKLGQNCKSPSKGYLTYLNYRLFLKFKINSIIIFALKTLLPKLSNQEVWFLSSMWIMEWILLWRMCYTSFSKKWWTYWYFKGCNLERIVLSVIIC